MSITNSSHLTVGHDPITAWQINLSCPGMAHFAATGPFGSCCKDCAFWETLKKRRRCAKFAQLTGKLGPPIRGDIESCRHFKRGDEK